MKQLIFSLRRPFRNLLHRRTPLQIARNSIHNIDYNQVEELDRRWLQNQFNADRNRHEDRRNLDEPEDLGESSASSLVQRNEEKDLFDGAYSGIMGIFDDPKKKDQRLFCSKEVRTDGNFKHRE